MIYILLFILLAEGALIFKDKFNWLFFIVIFIFTAIRFDVGKDYMTYYYAIIRNTSELSRFGEGFSLLVKLSQNYHYQLFFITTSLMIIGLTSISYSKLSKHFYISSIIFLAVPIFWVGSLSIIRQFVALSIVLAGTPYILKRKALYFYLLVALAFFFHRTAVLAIPLYFFPYIKANKWFHIAIIGFTLFGEKIIYFTVKLLLPSYLKYLELNYGDNAGGQMNMFLMVLFCLFFFTFKNKVVGDKTFNFYYVSVFIGTSIYAMLNKYGHAGMRGSLYYTMYLPLLYPYYLNLWPRKIKSEVIIFFSVILFFSIYLITIYIPLLKGTDSSILPYKVFFLDN